MRLARLQKLITDILSEKIEADFWATVTGSEWRTLFAFALEQKLSVLLYKTLRQNKIKIPEKLAAEMKEVYYSSCTVDFCRREQIKDIIQLFNDNNIEHILLKGAALCNREYRDSFCRIMSDIDLLVQGKDGLKAYDLLVNSGYSNGFKSHEKLKPGFFKHYPALYPPDGLPVEIHTYLDDKYQTNQKRVWNRSETIEIDGRKSNVSRRLDNAYDYAQIYCRHGNKCTVGLSRYMPNYQN